MKKINGIIYAMLSSAAFGLSPIWTKDACNRGTNSITMLLSRVSITAIILFIYFLIKRVDFKVSKNQLVSLVFISIIGYASTTICLFLSYNHISVGLATTMHFVYPAVVTILMCLIYKEKIHFGKILSIFLSICGIYCLIYTKNMNINFKGVFLAIISGIFYSIYIIGVEKGGIEELDVLVSTFYITLITSICVFIFGQFSVGIKIVYDCRVFIDAMCGAIFSTLLALVAFVKGIKIIGSSNASILSTFEPIVSVIMGIIVLSEEINLSMVLGTILIIISVIFLTVWEKIREKKYDLSQNSF
ncbi:DMT family transporter [Clostridium brassicae]|uniref:DMT family transporter n=1 Tax=Clostridium brassicae TaxID=2999072 RepID=A0ABT4D5A3_9CLOT|nr:DMT family transporter [Clostridium brassicae]MCY6957465.1 DMT family transporter [Clostridium brassicae]